MYSLLTLCVWKHRFWSNCLGFSVDSTENPFSILCLTEARGRSSVEACPRSSKCMRGGRRRCRDGHRMALRILPIFTWSFFERHEHFIRVYIEVLYRQNGEALN